MTRPEDVPEDVWAKAPMLWGYEARIGIARSVMAETARCAKMLDDAAEGERDLQRAARADKDRDASLVHMYCAQALEERATAIRSPHV